jgi:hypothetical protein
MSSNKDKSFDKSNREITMKQSRTIATGLVVLAGMALTALPVSAQYFKGKTITVLVGYSPGGGADTQSRLLTPFMAGHVPGNPKMIVKNMTGGGGTKAQNYLYERAKKDGLTIVYAPAAPQDQLLARKGIRYDYGKISVIGAMVGAPVMAYARKDLVPGGMTKPEDIIGAKGIKIGGRRGTSWLDLFARGALDTLGLKYTYVPGYRGGARVSAGVRRNETNMAGNGLDSWIARFAPSMAGPKGSTLPLWYYQFRKPDGTPLKSVTGGLRSFESVYRGIHGKAPSGPFWDKFKYLISLRSAVTHLYLGPPGMNKQALADLRTGFDKMIVDTDAMARQKKVLHNVYRPVSREGAAKAFKSISQVDPAVVKYWKNYVRQGKRRNKKKKN